MRCNDKEKGEFTREVEDSGETEEQKATVQVNSRGLAGWTESKQRCAECCITSLDAVTEAGGPHTGTLDMTAWDALQRYHPTHCWPLLDILPAL